MLLLDTNVQMYAEGREHPYQESCRKIMESAKISPAGYAVDAEMLQELLYSYSKRGEVSRGIDAVEDLLSTFPTIIPITADEITIAMRLMAETPGIEARDAIHAAVVIGHGLEGIVSADRDFDRIPGLRRFDPMEVAAG